MNIEINSAEWILLCKGIADLRDSGKLKEEEQQLANELSDKVGRIVFEIAMMSPGTKLHDKLIGIIADEFDDAVLNGVRE